MASLKPMEEPMRSPASLGSSEPMDSTEPMKSLEPMSADPCAAKTCEIGGAHGIVAGQQPMGLQKQDRLWSEVASTRVGGAHGLAEGPKVGGAHGVQGTHGIAGARQVANAHGVAGSHGIVAATQLMGSLGRIGGAHRVAAARDRQNPTAAGMESARAYGLAGGHGEDGANGVARGRTVVAGAKWGEVQNPVVLSPYSWMALPQTPRYVAACVLRLSLETL